MGGGRGLMAVWLADMWRRAQHTYGPEAVPMMAEAVRQLATTDLLCYGLHVHGHEHPIMRRIAYARHAHIMAASMERNRKTMRICAPAHGKTTLSRWKIELWLGQQTELAYQGKVASPAALYLMNTAEQAQKQCMAIASTLESNPRYKELFPHVQPHTALGWTKDVLFLRRPYARPDPSLMATGMFGPYQGYRFGQVAVDDPTDQEDARSETTMEKQRERFFGTLMDRLTDDTEGDAETAECHLSCTRWGKRDIPEMVLKDDEWASEIMPCYGYWDAHPEWGHLWQGQRPSRALWPEVWPESKLERKRREKELTQNSALWQLAYLCSPVQAEGEMFHRSWLKSYLPSDLEAA